MLTKETLNAKIIYLSILMRERERKREIERRDTLFVESFDLMMMGKKKKWGRRGLGEKRGVDI